MDRTAANTTIYIPDQSYARVAAGSEGELPDPAGHDKALAFTGSASSGSLSMAGVEDFAVSAEISPSMVSVPSDWPAYDMLRFDSAHTSGNGAAKIHIDRISSSFVFE